MTKKPDFIDRDVLLKMARHRVDIKGREYEGITKGVNLALELIEDFVRDAPSADAVEVVHGYDTCKCRIFHCSECGYGVNDIFQEDERNYPVGEFNYCPHCGARMDAEVGP